MTRRNHAWGEPPRWAWVVAALTAAAAALVVLVSAGGASPDASNETPPPEATALSSRPTAVSPTVITLPTHPELFVLGDSYTQGNGAVRSDRTFAHTAAAQLGWDLELDGAGGTGFLNGGPSRAATYGQRVLALELDEDPDVLLVQGGISDRGQQGSEALAALGALQLLRQKFPSADVVLMGPVDPSPPDSQITTITEQLRDAAAAAEVPFIDASGWITTTNFAQYSSGDGTHLNQAGYDYMGIKVAEELRALADG